MPSTLLARHDAYVHLTANESSDHSSDLVQRARSGDHAAFEQLYRAHSPRVYALCLRLAAGDRVAATALLQDVAAAEVNAILRWGASL